jgi:hypothetical protein
VTEVPPGGLAHHELPRMRSELRKIPVSESMLDSLECLLRTYKTMMAAGNNGRQAFDCAAMWRERISPLLLAVNRGKGMDYLDGKHPLTVLAMDRLTAPK